MRGDRSSRGDVPSDRDASGDRLRRMIEKTRLLMKRFWVLVDRWTRKAIQQSALARSPRNETQATRSPPLVRRAKSHLPRALPICHRRTKSGHPGQELGIQQPRWFSARASRRLHLMAWKLVSTPRAEPAARAGNFHTPKQFSKRLGPTTSRACAHTLEAQRLRGERRAWRRGLRFGQRRRVCLKPEPAHGSA